MSEAPLGKLVFPQHFYGRQFELQQLKDAYDRLSGVSLIMLGGYAGTGKTRLVERFAETIGGYFLTGKADELINDPFTSIIDAFSCFCDDVLTGDVLELQRVRSAIKLAVGDEGKVLTDLIPKLQQVIGDQSDSVLESKQSSLHRLHFIVAEFVRVIATPERPVVLYFDDMQWIDPASLDLAVYLAMEPRLQHVMIIGAYRDNEVSPVLTSALELIRQHGRAYVTLHIGNLSLDDIQQLLVDTLSMDMERAAPLAETVFGKTSGNIFFTKASLVALEQRGILSYSYATMSWVYDLQRVREEMGLSDNVVSLVMSRLERLPDTVQVVLVTAAFCGSTFKLGTLEKLLQARQATHVLNDLAKYLDVGVAEGLLENMIGSPKYQFVHKRISEAALALIPQDERDYLSLVIGRCLMELSLQSNTTDGGLVFVAADRLNSVPIRILTEHIRLVELVELNMKAGERAMSISAFAMAAIYFCRAVELLELDDERWESRYDICLRLYSTAADVEFCVGSFDRAKSFADEVLINASCFDDKLMAYVALADGLGQREKHADALEIDKKVLNHLGELPKRVNVVNALWQASQLNRAFARLTDEDVLTLPMMMDRVKLKAVAALSKLAVRAFYCKKLTLSLCCVLRQVRLTLDYGLSAAGAFALSGYGTLLWNYLGDEKGGRRLIGLSLRVMRLTNAKQYEAKILFNASNYVNPWIQPLTKVMEDCNMAYRSGMESGDVEFGFMAFGEYSVLSYVSGLPLETTLADLDVFLRLLKQYNVEAVFAVISALKELVLGLAGLGMDLEGLRVEAKALARNKVKDPSLTLGLADRYTAFMQLAYFFGDYRLADEMFVEANSYATACFRQSKKRKFKTRANAAISTMKKIMVTKGINITHKAEYEATFPRRGGITFIKECFDKAISAASRAGVMHEAALANERAGEYFASKQDDFWAKHYFTHANNLYSSWGAVIKVNQLEYIVDKHASLRMGTVRKSRAAMANSAVAMHSTIDAERSTVECVSFTGVGQDHDDISGSFAFSVQGSIMRDKTDAEELESRRKSSQAQAPSDDYSALTISSRSHLREQEHL